MKNQHSPQPYWVLLGGCILAFLSASVNAGLFLTLGNSVAQMSGEISRMAQNMIRPDINGLGINVFLTISAFLMGSAIAGFTIHHPTLDKTLPYGRCMMFIGGCLLSAHYTLEILPRVALAFGGFASGFQNAIATHYRGIVLRTTHITGLMTDVGSHLGMLFRGHRIALWKIWVPAVVILFFFIGGIFGSWLYIMEKPFLLILAAAYVFGGFVWFLIHRLILKVT
ncbi:MAG: DUF1275 domain-containing protein [Verrucomicrobia bacterium]|nr:DUF1275 domain-containing protein [Verrucomicrobiota bacterium]MCH8511636.1 DUF1275 domain-containing protein [Kiritimatiellia bacterium]